MIVGLKPYPAMKDSGVPWLGEVPVHWEARQLGQFGMLLKGSGGTKEDEVPAGIPCVRYGDLYTSHEYFILKARSFVSSAKAKEYTPIKFGDVLFAASGETIEEIGKSAVNLIPSQACCGGDVILFRPNREVDARYLGYGTDCTPSALQKATMGRGITVMHIYGDQLKRLSMALPPLLEQAAIVRYLDHADRRIRRYIRAKQKLSHAAGGAEAGHHPPSRHGPDRCPHRPALSGLQALRRGVAGGCAGALGGRRVAAQVCAVSR